MTQGHFACKVMNFIEIITYEDDVMSYLSLKFYVCVIIFEDSKGISFKNYEKIS